MRRLRLSALIACALLIAPLSARAQSVPVVGPKSVAFTANGQSSVWSCTNGQGSFQLHVPAGLTGTITVAVSQSAGGPFVNPPWSFGPGSATYANTITNSGDLSVALASNLYVQVSVTAYTSGSTTVLGTCSSAQAAPPPLPIPTDTYGNVQSALSPYSYFVIPAGSLCVSAPCVVKSGSAVYFGILNPSDIQQNVGSSYDCIVYNSAGAASGDKLFQGSGMGPDQYVVAAGSAGIKMPLGIVVQCLTAPVGNGLILEYR